MLRSIDPARHIFVPPKVAEIGGGYGVTFRYREQHAHPTDISASDGELIVHLNRLELIKAGKYTVDHQPSVRRCHDIDHAGQHVITDHSNIVSVRSELYPDLIYSFVDR